MEQQNNLKTSGQRIIGLDAMRAILALFGIMMHSAASYEVTIKGIHIPWHIFTSNGTFFFNWFALWIHAFYMPAFFFISGFLSYKIYKKRQFSGLAHSRLTRIAIPFLLIYLSPVIYTILMSVFIPSIRHLITSHQMWVSLKNTGSFWFLYYLFIMDLAALFVVSLKRLAKPFSFLKEKKGVTVSVLSTLILVPFIVLLISKDWFTPLRTSIVPNIPVLVYYGAFFTLGWIVQQHYQYLIRFSKRFWLPLASISLLSITGSAYLGLHYIDSNAAREVAGILYNITALSMFLALLGFCLTKFQRYSTIIQYLSDSSYWLYISQIPIVLFLEYLLSSIHMPLFVKFVIVVLSTVSLCLISYQLIIRKRKMFNYIDCRRKSPSSVIAS